MPGAAASGNTDLLNRFKCRTDILLGAALLELALRIDGQRDAGALVAAGVGPYLRPGIDFGHRERIGVEIVFARLERLFPHADTADRDDRRGEALHAAAWVVGTPDDLAIGRLLGLQRAEIDIRPDVRLDDADKARRDFLRVPLIDAP